DFMRKGWTAGSTIRRQAGREKDYGQPTGRELLFTRRVVKERPARSCISSFAPTRSRTRPVPKAVGKPEVIQKRGCRKWKKSALERWSQNSVTALEIERKAYSAPSNSNPPPSSGSNDAVVQPWLSGTHRA